MKPARLTLDFDDDTDPPRVGEFWMCRKGKIAFEVTAARQTKGRPLRWRLSCARWSPTDIPEHARLRTFVRYGRK